MKDFSIIYEITKWPVYCAVHLFYKGLKLKNPENLPSRGPVLICSNHANAFMDPSIVFCHMRRQIYSLARGDAFKGKLVTWILHRLKINPIFRISEGIENLHKNEEAFVRSFEILERKNSLIMYPEGICIQEKRLRKLKKGAARIAFGVEEKNNFNLDLAILPMALNYSNAKKFRSKLLVNFGEPFQLSAYKELYQQDKVKAINEFTKHLEVEMAKLMVIVDDKNNDELYEHILEVYKEEVIFDHKWNPKDTYHDYLASKLLAEKLNQFSIAEPKKTEELKITLRSYFDKLQFYQLRDHLLRNNNPNIFNLFQKILIVIVGLPFYLMGLIFNYVPYRIAYFTAQKKARNIEFHASVAITVGMLVWILYYFVQLLIIGIISHSWIIIFLTAIFIPATGIFAVRFYPFIKRATGTWRLINLFKRDKKAYNALIKLREQAISELQELRIKE